MAQISDIATPEWLTPALSEAGILDGEQVEAVSTRPLKLTSHSTPKVALLDIKYSRADGPKKPKLAIKIADGMKEFTFFNEISPAMKIPEIISCYFATYDQEQQQTLLILEDLSDSHFLTDWPIPPEMNDCIKVVDCLAKIHAYWWNHPDLETDLSEKRFWGTNWLERINLGIHRIGEFIDFIGDRLSKNRITVYEMALASHNQSWRPDQTTYNKTLLHGDAHFWNFMYPKDSNTDTVQVIDWNSWDIGRATDDLAYLIGIHWYPERRQELEKKLLHRYRDHLQERITAYSWDQLWNDYRTSAIRNLFIPVWQWQRGINPTVWWPHLERSFLAFEDLNCREIL